MECLLFFRNKPKTFAFDHCFYSLDPSLESFASQDVVFDALGRDILDNAFQGYNACIFAYGQTGETRFAPPRAINFHENVACQVARNRNTSSRNCPTRDLNSSKHDKDFLIFSFFFVFP